LIDQQRVYKNGKKSKPRKQKPSLAIKSNYKEHRVCQQFQWQCGSLLPALQPVRQLPFVVVQFYGMFFPSSFSEPWARRVRIVFGRMRLGTWNSLRSSPTVDCRSLHRLPPVDKSSRVHTTNHRKCLPAHRAKIGSIHPSAYKCPSVLNSSNVLGTQGPYSMEIYPQTTANKCRSFAGSSHRLLVESEESEESGCRGRPGMCRCVWWGRR